MPGPSSSTERRNLCRMVRSHNNRKSDRHSHNTHHDDRGERQGMETCSDGCGRLWVSMLSHISSGRAVEIEIGPLQCYTKGADTMTILAASMKTKHRHRDAVDSMHCYRKHSTYVGHGAADKRVSLEKRNLYLPFFPLQPTDASRLYRKPDERNVSRKSRTRWSPRNGREKHRTCTNSTYTDETKRKRNIFRIGSYINLHTSPSGIPKKVRENI